jgi:tRNA dimethylallyltransferase
MPPGHSTLPRHPNVPETALPMPVSAPILGEDCLILTGPTASGKTAVAAHMAQRLGAEILSVDSIAVYRGLDIGSAKPTASEQAAVRHHLIDLVSPTTPFSVADWLAAAAGAVADCRRRGRRILLVGGTPLYLRCLRDGLDDLPASNEALRAQLVAEAAARGSEALHERLAAADPRRAAKIHPNDTKRIIRSLEVLEATSQVAAESWSAGKRPHFLCPLVVLDTPRRLLNERIDQRVDAMFARGILEETAAAEAAGGIGPVAAQAAGYAEARDCLEGRISKAEAVSRTKQRTRQLAKRQRTWLRSFSDAIWVTG